MTLKLFIKLIKFQFKVLNFHVFGAPEYYGTERFENLTRPHERAQCIIKEQSPNVNEIATTSIKWQTIIIRAKSHQHNKPEFLLFICTVAPLRSGSDNGNDDDSGCGGQQNYSNI